MGEETERLLGPAPRGIGARQGGDYDRPSRQGRGFRYGQSARPGKYRSGRPSSFLKARAVKRDVRPKRGRWTRKPSFHAGPAHERGRGRGIVMTQDRRPRIGAQAVVRSGLKHGAVRRLVGGRPLQGLHPDSWSADHAPPSTFSRVSPGGEPETGLGVGPSRLIRSGAGLALGVLKNRFDIRKTCRSWCCRRKTRSPVPGPRPWSVWWRERQERPTVPPPGLGAGNFPLKHPAGRNFRSCSDGPPVGRPIVPHETGHRPGTFPGGTCKVVRAGKLGVRRSRGPQGLPDGPNSSWSPARRPTPVV